MPNAVIAHDPDGEFDIAALKAQAAGLPRIDGLDLVPMVTSRPALRLGRDDLGAGGRAMAGGRGAEHHVVAIDYGVKRNILRLLAERGCKVTVVPATATADDILALKPDGVFLSNGPGDPAATGEYAVPVIRDAARRGACRSSASASATRCWRSPSARQTMKMHQGHHGANHPVKDFTTGKVEIVSMNHGFAVDPRHAAGQRARRRMSRCSTAPTAASR